MMNVKRREECTPFFLPMKFVEMILGSVINNSTSSLKVSQCAFYRCITYNPPHTQTWTHTHKSIIKTCNCYRRPSCPMRRMELYEGWEWGRNSDSTANLHLNDAPMNIFFRWEIVSNTVRSWKGIDELKARQAQTSPLSLRPWFVSFVCEEDR